MAASTSPARPLPPPHMQSRRHPVRLAGGGDDTASRIARCVIRSARCDCPHTARGHASVRAGRIRPLDRPRRYSRAPSDPAGRRPRQAVRLPRHRRRRPPTKTPRKAPTNSRFRPRVKPPIPRPGPLPAGGRRSARIPGAGTGQDVSAWFGDRDCTVGTAPGTRRPASRPVTASGRRGRRCGFGRTRTTSGRARSAAGPRPTSSGTGTQALRLAITGRNRILTHGCTRVRPGRSIGCSSPPVS